MLPIKIRSLILDMDGVIWKADAPIGNLSSIFNKISALGLKYIFATNNGTRTPEQYVSRLAGYGINVEPWQVVTSALATAFLLKHHHSKGSKVFVIGEAGVKDAILREGFEILDESDFERADAVVMGIDRKISFEKMCAAALLVGRGVPFYSTNSDKTFPTPQGEIPGSGAWTSVVTTATGKVPVFAGKPSPYLLEMARQRLGTARDETLVVGDRLETDIAGGIAAGIPVALVLSGVTSRKEGMESKYNIQFMAENLEKLIE